MQINTIGYNSNHKHAFFFKNEHAYLFFIGKYEILKILVSFDVCI